MIILWIVVVLGCLAGGLEFVGVVLSSSISAPQQAGAMSVAIGWAVIPYCLVRAIQLGIATIHDPDGDEMRSDLRKIRQLLEKQAEKASAEEVSSRSV